jgi:hypothetical protein
MLWYYLLIGIATHTLAEILLIREIREDYAHPKIILHAIREKERRVAIQWVDRRLGRL